MSINFDQFLVALSRVDVSLTLDEIKDFFSIVQGNQKRSKGKEATQFADSVHVTEVLQVLSL